MILVTRFPHDYLHKLAPEYYFFDIPRRFFGYVFSWRPPYVSKRKKPRKKAAEELADTLEEEIARSSRELSSGTLYAEGMKIDYVYDHGILRRIRVDYHQETEPYAIENGRVIKRPLAMMLLDYGAIMIDFSSGGPCFYTHEGAPIPGTICVPNDPIRTIPITIREESYSDAHSSSSRR